MSDSITPENVDEVHRMIRRALVVDDPRFDDQGEAATVVQDDCPTVSVGTPPDADLPYAKVPPDDAALAEGDICQVLRTFRKEGEVFPIGLKRSGEAKFSVFAFKMREAEGVAALAKRIHKLSREAEVINTYFMPNSLSPTKQKELAEYASDGSRIPGSVGDSDIQDCAWITWDMDPPDALDGKGVEMDVPASVEEHLKAVRAAEILQAHLRFKHGLPYPEIIKTGNGTQMFTELEPFPADRAGRTLVKKVHRAIGKEVAEEFAKLGVTFDPKVCNVATWARLAGTPNRKGTASLERPHAVARIIEGPFTVRAAAEDLSPERRALLDDCRKVSRAELERIAGPASTKTENYHAANVEEFIAKHLSDAEEKPDHEDDEGRPERFWEFRCRWADHHDQVKKAFLIEHENGRIIAGCLASKCDGKGLRELLDAVVPGWMAKPELQALMNPREIVELGQMASEIEERPVEWLWPGRIPRGKLTILEGDPDTSKSTLALTWAAHVTAGKAWPDGEPCEAANVIFFSTEDDPEDTSKPRLRVAGANMNRIRLVGQSRKKAGQIEPISLPGDAHLVERMISKDDARLIIFDPLVGYLGAETNTHKDSDIRRVLGVLADLAQRTDCAIVMLRHFTKTSDGKPIHRGGGSIGIVGAARAAFSVIPHPKDDPYAPDSRRVLWRVKLNIRQKPKPLMYRVVADGEVGRIEWIPGEVRLRAADLYGNPGPGSALDDAVSFLESMLDPPGTWKAQKEIRVAAKDQNIADATLRRAKDKLAIQSEQRGSAWFWALPVVEGVF
jgi:hypothetical protein